MTDFDSASTNDKIGSFQRWKRKLDTIMGVVIYCATTWRTFLGHLTMKFVEADLKYSD